MKTLFECFIKYSLELKNEKGKTAKNFLLNEKFMIIHVTSGWIYQNDIVI